jgi:hypothetical protein
MLILSTNPSGSTIFCDDIREEVTGKKSLIGVYNGAMMIASAAPAIIPQLCVLTTIRLDDDILPKKITIKIIFEDEHFFEQVIVSMDIEFPAAGSLEGSDLLFANKDGTKSAQLNNEAHIANLVLTSSGRIKVRMYDGDDVIALGSLRVIFQPQQGENEPALITDN